MKLRMIFIVIIIFLLGFIVRIGNIDLQSPDKSLYYDDGGLQYFQESDSYYNYRLTRNLLDHGYLGDKIIDGKPWDLHSYYPPGVPVDYPPLLSYITIGFYYILNFVTSMSLREACLWLPTIMGPLAAVIGFLFSRRLNGEFGGFITGVLVATAPLYVYKTSFGFFDTDMLNILFPLIIIWLLFEAENAKIKRNRMILAGCSGFFFFLFSLAWNGWIYYFYILLVAFLNPIKGRDFSLVLPFLSVSVSLIGIFNIFGLFNALMTPMQLAHLLGGGNIWYPWPYSYRDVAELQTPTMETFIVVASPLILIFGLIGLITLYRRVRSLTGLILFLWSVSSVFFHP
ncbi:MAG: STT3 domain-containing protein [Methanothermobacter tenebrarum]